MINSNFGKIHVYTGYGKGKTTASLGLAIRACGWGKKVAIIYFDKGNTDYGERKILDQLNDQITYYITGRNRIDLQSGKFIFEVEEIDKQEAARALRILADLFNEPSWDMLILDEINKAINLGMVEINEFLILLDHKPKYLELVLTGRDAHPLILERADLITEMKLVKHYFYQGVPAREGIEY